ncbi:efflux RND transporter periplasmic adaptor subunit [Mucilaginibacter psychrotolerans]|uniref:Efflux RND transporter periplasmic adaptor subunit n=1 Tax=Mucilaginibacter psychrotolerans TaxID=1524096 RepID=A0A4Y8S7M4_9SPHI|nr:efflux RND transporter periplasmic adaptor subunit [Mucilaginibacter psychrotolerans]TFF34585.1 efflux RND transporter periplasmic adaptor subunit [Mucilaginibacter psychrotolerans]
MKTTLTLAGAVLTALWITGCSNNTKLKPGPDTLAVKVFNLSANDSAINDRIVYDGTLEAEKTIDLSFQVSGTILSFPVKTGDYVEKGQLVASVDETTYRNQYNAQLAQAKLANENYTRINEVFKKGSVAEIKMLEAKSNYEQATSAARATYQNIAHTHLYAPVSGYVGNKMAEAGAVANPGQPVLQLLDTRSVKVLVAVPESEINRYKAGTIATIRIDALNNQPLQGKVTEVGVIALNGSANYNLKIALPNTGLQLRPGMLCKVSFDKADDKHMISADAKEIIVPVQAVQVDEKGNNFLYIMNAQNKAVRKEVVTGQLYSNGITITAGLAGNEQVITSGYQKLADQTPVIVSK